MFVYILSLTNNKYYVGRTANVMKRYDEHVSGNGSVWTKLYQPIALLNVLDETDQFSELNVTLLCMRDYQVENVRGSCFTQITLEDSEISIIQKMISGIHDECYICKSTTHYMNQCPRRLLAKKCDTCNETGHTSDSCSYSEIHCNTCGKTNHTSDKCFYNKIICNICGRNNHKADDCYANYHKNGEIICKSCYKTGHKSADCNLILMCDTCGRSGHSSESCYATTTMSGETICKNCKKTGHDLANCYTDNIKLCFTCGEHDHSTSEHEIAQYSKR